MDTLDYFNLPKENCRVLVIDDDKSHLDAMAAIFKAGRARADVVDNGFDGVERLRRMKYDLVVLDWQMPHMNGWRVLKAIERWALMYDTRSDHIPEVVVCTGQAAEVISLPISNLVSVRDIWQKSEGWISLRHRSASLLKELRQGV